MINKTDLFIYCDWLDERDVNTSYLRLVASHLCSGIIGVNEFGADHTVLDDNAHRNNLSHSDDYSRFVVNCDGSGRGNCSGENVFGYSLSGRTVYDGSGYGLVGFINGCGTTNLDGDGLGDCNMTGNGYQHHCKLRGDGFGHGFDNESD